MNPSEPFDAKSLIADLERDGYVVVKSFLDEGLIAQARRDMEALYEKDLEERRMRNMDEQLFTHGTTKSVLTKPSHLILGLPGKSKALDDCYEKIFADPRTSQIIKAISGGTSRFATSIAVI